LILKQRTVKKQGLSQKSKNAVAAPLMGAFSDQKRRHEACAYTLLQLMRQPITFFKHHHKPIIGLPNIIINHFSMMRILTDDLTHSYQHYRR